MSIFNRRRKLQPSRPLDRRAPRSDRYEPQPAPTAAPAPVYSPYGVYPAYPQYPAQPPGGYVPAPYVAPSSYAPAPYSPAPVFEEPTWLEGVLGRAVPQPYGGGWGPWVDLGENVQIRVRRGFKAIGQEMRRDQWVISIAPSLAGIGAGLLDLPAAALKSIVDLIAPLVKKKDAGAASAAPATPAPAAVGCAGCQCASCRARRGGW